LVAQVLFIKYDFDTDSAVRDGTARGYFASRADKKLFLPLIMLFRALTVITSLVAIALENCRWSKDEKSDYSRKKMLSRSILTSLMFVVAVCGVDNMFNYFGKFSEKQ
jgi:hypothetical protein